MVVKLRYSQKVRLTRLERCRMYDAHSPLTQRNKFEDAPLLAVSSLDPKRPALAVSGVDL
jgi:hypothetical protein